MTNLHEAPWWHTMVIHHMESWGIPINHDDWSWWAKLIHHDGPPWIDDSSRWIITMHHDASWWCILMIPHDELWWFILMNRADSQLLITVWPWFPFRDTMDLFAMGAINKCHTSFHGAQWHLFPSRDPQNGNCNSQGVVTKNSQAQIPSLQFLILTFYQASLPLPSHRAGSSCRSDFCSVGLLHTSS